MDGKLYLESALRDRLGVSDGLMKKTRREVVGSMNGLPLTTLTINGRNHVAFGEDVARRIVGALAGKQPRAGEPPVVSEESMAELLEFALVQGIPCEKKDGALRSDEVVLRISLITRNKMIMLAIDPDVGETVRLRVKDSTLFVQGMDVPGCRLIAPGVYEYAGRLPRSRGRW